MFKMYDVPELKQPNNNKLINKKDFLVVKKMAEEARIQNEKLSKKINTLEKKIVLLNKKFKK